MYSLFWQLFVLYNLGALLLWEEDGVLSKVAFDKTSRNKELQHLVLRRELFLALAHRINSLTWTKALEPYFCVGWVFPLNAKTKHLCYRCWFWERSSFWFWTVLICLLNALYLIPMNFIFPLCNMAAMIKHFFSIYMYDVYESPKIAKYTESVPENKALNEIANPLKMLCFHYHKTIKIAHSIKGLSFTHK